jgi:hypothetical protein
MHSFLIFVAGHCGALKILTVLGGVFYGRGAVGYRVHLQAPHSVHLAKKDCFYRRGDETSVCGASQAACLLRGVTIAMYDRAERRLLQQIRRGPRVVQSKLFCPRNQPLYR